MVACVLLKFRVSFLRVPVSGHIHLQSAIMKQSIPDRWTEYIPVGRRIPGTRFIAFKVPLKSMYDIQLKPWQRFSPSDLFKEVGKQKEELGLIVDLTCTQRYYSAKELPKTIMYSKIFTIGHQVPSTKVINQFQNRVKQYLSENSENDKLVGVHCTHGLNRTGYLVCRYLIDMLSMEPSEAIEKFNNSRGHSIERTNYLDDLLHAKSRSSAELNKPQVKNQQHVPGKNYNSRPPPRPAVQPGSHGAGFNKPQVKNPQHVPGKNSNSRPPPRPVVQPGSQGSAGFNKPQVKNQQHLPGKNSNSQPPPPGSQGSAGFNKPQVKNQQHVPGKNSNSRPPPPGRHGNTRGTPGCGPKTPGTPFAQPPLHHKQGQGLGPQASFPHSGGRNPSFAPKTPPPGFPNPLMQGPRHSLPQSEDEPPHHFSGPNRHRHHSQRPFPRHQAHDAVNGAPPQDCRPRSTQQNDRNPGNSFPAQPSRPSQRVNSDPYQKYPKPGLKKKPKKQWQ
ncbi:RNA/RNP complex-1-interacting phosphatase isoform X2 [Rhinoderma darwinii]|uniref:RNA/RNP complex-1-interacting phosphatase isoform X2 n=1 Tax=Rhinoderma darwinii TaxID=43563 RepID=UPI003F66419A